jgi:hypothetical protein
MCARSAGENISRKRSARLNQSRPCKEHAHLARVSTPGRPCHFPISSDSGVGPRRTGRRPRKRPVFCPKIVVDGYLNQPLPSVKTKALPDRFSHSSCPLPSQKFSTEFRGTIRTYVWSRSTTCSSQLSHISLDSREGWSFRDAYRRRTASDRRGAKLPEDTLMAFQYVEPSSKS